MKRIIIILSIALFITQLVCQPACAQTDAVLQESDVTGIKIEKTELSQGQGWWSSQGVRQHTAIQGIKALILYEECNSVDEAHQMAVAYSKNMASIFYPGLWDGAQSKSIGDESWYGSDITSALLFRTGRTCVLVSCRGEDVAKRKQVAELLAKQIEYKIKKGGRVTVFDNNQKLNKRSMSESSTNIIKK